MHRQLIFNQQRQGSNSFNGITNEPLERVWNNMNARTNHVVRLDGGHIEQGDT